jgi:hypothetical protein
MLLAVTPPFFIIWEWLSDAPLGELGGVSCMPARESEKFFDFSDFRA